MSLANRLFCLWFHRTLLLACTVTMIVYLAAGFGPRSLVMLFGIAGNAFAAEVHRRLLERER